MRPASLLAVLAMLAVSGCLPSKPSASSGGEGTLVVRVTAGPVCPVEQVPPEPGCEPRPVAGAPVFVQPGDGRDIMVAQATTDDDGMARITLPAGDYIVAGGDVEGLMGRPSTVGVVAAADAITTVDLVYDTGIR
jgi:hypothetical protein